MADWDDGIHWWPSHHHWPSSENALTARASWANPKFTASDAGSTQRIGQAWGLEGLFASQDQHVGFAHDNGEEIGSVGSDISSRSRAMSPGPSSPACATARWATSVTFGSFRCMPS